MKPLEILAILAVRNEATYLLNAIEYLWCQGLSVAVIDNGSTDGSWELAESLLNRHPHKLSHCPWDGMFSLQRQLELKAEIAGRSDADWIVHVDADEVLQSPLPGEALRSGIERASALGANCINFREFVFLPIEGLYRPDVGAIQAYCDYYYFAPSRVRLLRAWRRDTDLTNISSGGHTLIGKEIRQHTEDFILRHYIFADQTHAMTKYTDRLYAPAELARGWHGNRVGFPPSKFIFPTKGLIRLPSPDSVDFDVSDPKSKHYWEW